MRSRGRFVPLAMVCSLGVATVAPAQDRRAHIEQIGSHNTAEIIQMGTSDVGTVDIRGTENQLTLRQEGEGGNAADISVDGDMNVADLQQGSEIGAGNVATLMVQGSGNQALLSQLAFAGEANRIDLLQQGDGNSAMLTQMGDGNRIDLQQLGDLNDATVSQFGSALAIALSQEGGAAVAVTQTNP